MENTNEYKKDGSLYVREIKSCKCSRKNGNEYWVDCKIHQRGEHPYLYSNDNDYISKFRGGKKFYLEEEALNKVKQAVSEFKEDIEAFKNSSPQQIELKEINTTVYYRHLLAWNNYRKYAFLTEFHLNNGDVITEGVKEGGFGTMIWSIPSRLDIQENEERLQLWEILGHSDKTTINENPFYLSALESGDELMVKQIKLYYNIITARETAWLSKQLGYRILPQLNEKHNRYYAVSIQNIDMDLLHNSGYTIWHRPYFAMRRSTHSAWSLNPHTRDAVDAAKEDEEVIDFCDFLKLFDDESNIL